MKLDIHTLPLHKISECKWLLLLPFATQTPPYFADFKIRFWIVLGCSWNKGLQVHQESWIDLPFCVNKTWKTIKHFKARFLKVKRALIEV